MNRQCVINEVCKSNGYMCLTTARRLKRRLLACASCAALLRLLKAAQFTRRSTHVSITFANFNKCAIVLLSLILLSSCATSFDKRGVYHKVRMGDSIWRIARAYRADVQRIAEYNNILNPDDVQPGMKLYIPPRSGGLAFKKLPSGTESGKKGKVASRFKKKKSSGDEYSKPIQLYRGKFEWPVDGRAGSPFGIRNGRRHDGLDIGASSGTPIHASADGRVVFAGEMRGYGRLILIRHKDDFFTAYAHNSENRVKKGQAVKQGQVIGKVGRTGRATAPHLHFEIRHRQTARNPLFFLPDKKIAMRR